jgi:hypothetical protein
LSAANKLSFFVVESDSSDGTAEALARLSASNDNFRFTSLGNLSEVFRKRTERIAVCRNRYLEELQGHPDYREAHMLSSLIGTASTTWCRRGELPRVGSEMIGMCVQPIRQDRITTFGHSDMLCGRLTIAGNSKRI